MPISMDPVPLAPSRSPSAPVSGLRGVDEEIRRSPNPGRRGWSRHSSIAVAPAHSLLRLSAIVLLGTALGCGAGEETPEPAGEPPRAEGGGPAQAEGGGPAQAGSEVQLGPLQVPPPGGDDSTEAGITVPAPGAPEGEPGRAGPRQDSLDLSEIRNRVLRLEAENDSLRAAVGALLTYFAGASPQGSRPTGEASEPLAAGDSGGVARDLLEVDTRQVQHWGLRIVVAVFFLVAAGIFIRLVVWVLDKLAERGAKRRLLFKRLVPIVRISLWFITILFIGVVVLRIQSEGLLAAGAALGVAVGFAAQDILKNVFGGLIVLFDQPFQVGDKISVAGTYGEVVSIGLRSTRIVTPDDNLVSVPNAQVVDGQVANANSGELNCQVVTDLFLPGWADEAKAKRIAFEAAASSRYVFLNKPIVVLVKDEFRETFLLHLKVKAYVLDPRYEFLFMSDVTERARAGFRKGGLLGAMHGVRAYIDMDRFPEHHPGRSGGEEGE